MTKVLTVIMMVWPSGSARAARLRADVAAGAGLVLDHDRLVPALAQLLADDARQHVDAGAGRERHDDEDRAVGKPLCERRGGEHQRERREGGSGARRRSDGFMRKLGGLMAVALN